MLFKRNVWSKARARYVQGQMDVQSFLDAVREQTLYYSTPLGNDAEGKPHLYILSSANAETGYYPAFLPRSGACSFSTTLEGRASSSSREICTASSLDSSPVLQALGAIIEPNCPDETVIPPGFRTV